MPHPKLEKEIEKKAILLVAEIMTFAITEPPHKDASHLTKKLMGLIAEVRQQERYKVGKEMYEIAYKKGQEEGEKRGYQKGLDEKFSDIDFKGTREAVLKEGAEEEQAKYLFMSRKLAEIVGKEQRQKFIEELAGIGTEIEIDFERMLKLYKGKLPFVVWQGKADEKEKVAIYYQVVKDVSVKLQKLMEKYKR